MRQLGLCRERQTQQESADAAQVGRRLLIRANLGSVEDQEVTA
jgi:hypothetical protein